MFEILMHPYQYRVDYLNLQAAHTSEAFGLYVRGELDVRLPYSLQAKHHLIAGLALINQFLNRDNLVAVYIDIASLEDCRRPAYLQMKADIAEGLFSRIVTISQSDLMGDPCVDEDILAFAHKIPDLSLLVYESGAFVQVKFVHPCHSMSAEEQSYA